MLFVLFQGVLEFFYGKYLKIGLCLNNFVEISTMMPACLEENILSNFYLSVIINSWSYSFSPILCSACYNQNVLSGAAK